MWNLLSGSKGAIFSLDVALGIFLAIFVLGMAAYYSSSAEIPAATKQMERVGYDVVALLNEQGVFDSGTDGFLSVSSLENRSLNSTPDTYGIKLNITGSFPGSPVLTTPSINTNGSVVSGMIPISSYNHLTKLRYPATVRFYIWPK